MNKNISYDFTVDSVVAVDAPIGTDPDTLIQQVKQKLIQRIQEDDVTIVFENIYDGETGAYDENWEDYTRDQNLSLDCLFPKILKKPLDFTDKYGIIKTYDKPTTGD